MVFCELTNKLHPRECVCVLSYEVKFEALCSTVASSFFVVSANLSSSKVSIGSSHYYSHRPHFPHSSHTQSSKVGKDLELQMACSDIFVLVQPNGYIKDTVGGATFQSWDPLLMNFDTDHQESLLELKNLILANMGELGRKKISHMAYKLHVQPVRKPIRKLFNRTILRVQSPVISPSFVFPNRVENVKVDGKRTNVCASPANMASRGVAVDKLCLPPKTANIGGACSVFPPPTSKKSSFVDTGADLGLSPPIKMQKMVDGKGKPVENGVLIPDIEESNVYSKPFQAQDMCRNLEPPITSKSQMVLEGRVKELEIRLESKENKRAALEELKVTLTAKISNLENKLKEADKEKKAQLRKEKTASKGIIEPLEAEVKHLRCSVLEAKEGAHKNIMEQNDASFGGQTRATATSADASRL
ncbi:hypothetical protein AHAS_Ahas06G0262500 [Arachis hypogaea]